MKTALVTGGGIGIGAAIATQLAADGYAVAITYRTHRPGPDVVARLAAHGIEPLQLEVEATDAREVAGAVDQTIARFGSLDVLVNNVGGLVQRARLEDLSEDLWQRVQDVNVTSTFLFAKYALPHLRKGAKIINISSLAAENGGHPGALAYATSKGAILSFTRALAKELAPQGISVNAVCPGFIEATPFHDTFTSAESKAHTLTTIPEGRAGEPSDVAGAVSWLASDASSFVNGAVIDVNGAQYFA